MEKNDSGIRPLSGHFCNNGKNDSERQSFKPFNLKWWYNGHDEHAHNATSFCFKKNMDERCAKWFSSVFRIRLFKMDYLLCEDLKRVSCKLLLTVNQRHIVKVKVRNLFLD